MPISTDARLERVSEKESTREEGERARKGREAVEDSPIKGVFVRLSAPDIGAYIGPHRAIYGPPCRMS